MASSVTQKETPESLSVCSITTFAVAGATLTVPAIEVTPATQVREGSMVFPGRIVATGTVDGVTRRVYEEARATASANVVGVLGVNLIGSLNLQLAKPVPGTLRECTPKGATVADPSAGC